MHKIKVDPNIYTDRPTTEGRLDKEMKVYELLEKLEIPFQRLDHEVANTVDECHEIEALLDIPIYKNLFLCNKQETDFYLLLMPGYKSYKAGEISRQIGSSRLSFGPMHLMEEFLGVTPGSVTVLGLMNDTAKRVNLLIDEEVLEGGYIGCHPCINTSSLKIKTSDIIEKFIPYTGHSIQYVK